MRAIYLKFSLLAAGLLLATGLYAQKPATSLVTIILKNTTLLPKKFSIVSYSLSETGNNAAISYFMPGIGRRFVFEEGTKIYLASEEQVQTVMSGQGIDTAKPFLVVKKTDAGKTFPIK